MSKKDSEKKDLSFTSVGELNKISEDVKVTIDNAYQCKQYCKAANDIFRKADNFFKMQDEEQAYMLFMRYFYITQTIKKSYEFVKSKNTYVAILKECNSGVAMTKAEKLSESLRSRYEKRTQELLEKKEAEKRKVLENAAKKEISDDFVLPDVPKDFDDSSTPKQEGTDGEDKAAQNHIDSGEVYPTKAFISVTDFYTLIKDNKDNLDIMMIIDVRAPDEYNASRINYKCSINVPEYLLQPGANINSIERKLSKSTWDVWSSRFEKKYIIIMNYEFNVNIAATSASLFLLQDVLCKFPANYRVLIMEGGFKQWILHYPSMTTNPFYSKPTMPVLLDSTTLLKNLTYPELPSTQVRKNELNNDKGQISNKPSPNIKDANMSINEKLNNFVSADKEFHFSDLDVSQKNNIPTCIPNTAPVSRNLTMASTLIAPSTSSTSATSLNSQVNKKPSINIKDNIVNNTGTIGNRNDMPPSSIRSFNVPPEINKSSSATSLMRTNHIPTITTSVSPDVNSTRLNMSTSIPGINPVPSGIKPVSSGILSNNASSGILSNTASSGIMSNNASSGILPNTTSSGIMSNNASQDILASNVSSTVKVPNIPNIPSNVPSSNKLSNPPSTTVPSNIPSTIIPNNIPSTIVPNNVPSTITPSNVPSTVIPINARSTIIPSNVPSTIIPGNVLPTTIPINAQSTTIPINAPSTIIPSNVASTIIPSNVPSTIIPSTAPSTIIPSTTPHNIPGNVTSKNIPSNIQHTNIPSNIQPAFIPGNVQPAITPSNVTPTVIPTNVSSISKPNVNDIKAPSTQSSFPTGITPPSSSHINTVPGVPNTSVSMPQGAAKHSSVTPIGAVQPAAVHQAPISQGQPQVPPVGKPNSNASKSRQPSHQAPTLKKAGPQIKKLTTTFGLPYGWEKAVSHETGRIYYKDHNTHSTHWTLPPEIVAQIHQNESHLHDHTNKGEKVAPTSLQIPSETNKSGLKRSLSSPNIAELVDNAVPNTNKEKTPTSTRPVIDRSVKPKEEKQVLVDRTKKPISASRLHNLCPVYGSLGYALTGLKNLGNTCYMNSVIQCLSNTEPLKKYFTTGSHEHDLNTRNMNSHPGEIARELSFLVIVLSAGQYRSVSPLDFKHALGRFSIQFNNNQQQDSHELLMFLLDGLHEDINKVKTRHTIKDRSNEHLPDNVAAEHAWSDYLLNNNSIIVNLFQGQFRSTVVCLSCGEKSKTFDAFNCLQLELPANKSSTLEHCISSFSKPEKIGGNNSWKCSKCRCYREASKTIEVWKLPPVLIIQLKRFRCDGRWRNKIQSSINFPLQNFNMANHVVSPTATASSYRLYAVINHYGSFESGHYTAFCENSQSGRWHCFDDNIVKELDTGSIRTSAAYLLFYTHMNFKEYISSKI